MVLELEEFLDDVAAADGDLLEADELANAVIDVDDQILDLEVAQVRKECRGQGALSTLSTLAALFLKNVGLNIKLEAWGLLRRAGRPQSESARQPSFGHQHRA